MADRRHQIESARAEANELISKARETENHAEALEYCTQAGNCLLNVINVGHPHEKHQIRAQFKAIVDYADSRKNLNRNPVTEWVTNIATGGPDAPRSEHSSSEHMTTSSTSTECSLITLPDAPVSNVRGGGSSSNFAAADVPQMGYSSAPIYDTPLLDFSVGRTASHLLDHESPDTQTIDGPEEQDEKYSQPTDGPKTVRPAPSISGFSRTALRDAEPDSVLICGFSRLAVTSGDRSTIQKIRRLREPQCTRKLTTKEQILILKSSRLNGFKFPPWSTPTQAEFEFDDKHTAFHDSRQLGLSPDQLRFFERWARASIALPPPTTPDAAKLTPLMSTNRSIDLVQDAGTDCSVVASLCAVVARTERGHEELLCNKIWPYSDKEQRPVISKNGKYILRLNFNGCWRRVVIDDKLPLSKTNRVLHVLDRSNPALLWPALLEKAYLKVRGGYDFPGSDSCGDLWALTGWIPEQIYLQENDTVPAQLWTRIFRAFQYGDVLVTAGTGKMTRRHEKEVGLEGQHSYVILDMQDKGYEKLFLLKNPWIQGDLRYGPESSTFWKPMEFVVRHFESLYLNWNPGLFSHREDIHFEWNIPSQAEHAGPGLLVDNPQFSFTSRFSGPVWLVLARHFRDEADGSSHPHGGNSLKGYMNIVVCNANGERIFMRESCLESGAYVDTPQALLRWNSEAHTTYTIVIDQEDLLPSDYSFTLSAFTNSDITLAQAAEKYGLVTSASGGWTQETAGGDTTSPKYFENPQYTLQVKEKTSLGIVISGKGHQYPVHVKLVYGYGKRVCVLRNRDILAASGEYRSGCAVAQKDDLPTGTYTLICSLFEAGKTGEFQLKVYSTKAVQLTPLPREGAGFFSMKLPLACIGPKVHRLATPLYIHRLSRVSFIARLVNVTTPQPTQPALRARSPLRLSVDLGTGPNMKSLACSSSGEYSQTTTVRCEGLDLDPQTLPPGNVWLVIDRLSGPFEPIEEWYEVEVFADVPKALDVSHWRELD
ncbi:cysteine proteinase [Delitschia confertaspora ATCC 74209]|uniref:Cysteine proteinase n=1 Tax=Delitschia confertaspora ATCC 74209 TaxID=1513339 RepID=A0A9P4JI05_9PLEO|nr:cysteine proteinase [Delitschia confertaspora ATCC 74209]